MNFADYEHIKEVIGDIYEENSDFLRSIPINVSGLAKRMGFKIIYLSDLVIYEDGSINMRKLKHFYEINDWDGLDGCSFFDSKRETYIIFVNDLTYSKNRIRFTIAHEIGHIVLGHTEKLDIKEAEAQANYFAGYLMLPDCLGKIPGVFDRLTFNLSDTAKKFGLSIDTAGICINHMENRLCSCPPENDYEKIIINCLKGAVLTKLRD